MDEQVCRSPIECPLLTPCVTHVSTATGGYNLPICNGRGAPRKASRAIVLNQVHTRAELQIPIFPRSPVWVGSTRDRFTGVRAASGVLFEEINGLRYYESPSWRPPCLPSSNEERLGTEASANVAPPFPSKRKNPMPGDGFLLSCSTGSPGLRSHLCLSVHGLSSLGGASNGKLQMHESAAYVVSNRATGALII